jgi:hypothetical protein
MAKFKVNAGAWATIEKATIANAGVSFGFMIGWVRVRGSQFSFIRQQKNLRYP